MGVTIQIDRSRPLHEGAARGHNRWHPDLAPVASVEPGGEVTFEIRDSRDRQFGRDSTHADVLDLPAIAHPLTGPLEVRGAQPGDVLEVKILAIDLPIDYGYNGCSGYVRTNCQAGAGTRILQLDKKTMTSEFAPGIVIPLKPFFGSMGVAPAVEMGRVSSNPPGRHAGNLDNRELVAGSTLYIPVFVEGALFEVGDGHAAQGDGEVDQTAIETSLRGRLQLTVRKDMTLTWPRAETATDYITMATDPDLTVATKAAIQEMVDFLSETRGLTKHQAYQLVSLAGNVAVTQLVDRPVYGVHVRMPKSVFQ